MKGVCTVEIRINDKVSSKSGNPYSTLEIIFDTGYKFETFLNNEQKMLIQMALERKEK